MPDFNRKGIVPSEADISSTCPTTVASPDSEDCGASGRGSPSLGSNDGLEVCEGGSEFAARSAWMAGSTSSDGPPGGANRRAALRQQGHEVLQALHSSKAPLPRSRCRDKSTLRQFPGTWIGVQPDRSANLSWLEAPAGGNARAEQMRIDVSTLAAFHGSPSQVWHSDGVIFSL